MITYQIDYRFRLKETVLFRLQRDRPSDETEPVLLVEIYNIY